MKASSIKPSCITKLYVHWNTSFCIKKKKKLGKVRVISVGVILSKYKNSFC